MSKGTICLTHNGKDEDCEYCQIQRVEDELAECVTQLTDCQDALEESQAEGERLAKMIVAFCNSQSWAVESWKNQEHIKPLFDFVEERSRDE